MRLAIVPLLMVSFFAHSEQQNKVEEVVPESNGQISTPDWDKVKSSSLQAIQDFWGLSKEGSTELWEQGKKNSKDAWQSSKDKSSELWEQGKENSEEMWGELKSDSQEAWSDSKSNLQELFEKEEDLTNNDEI
jgi:hypothetical protein